MLCELTELLTWTVVALQKIRTVELDGKVIKLQIVSLMLLSLLQLRDDLVTSLVPPLLAHVCM